MSSQRIADVIRSAAGFMPDGKNAHHTTRNILSLREALVGGMPVIEISNVRDYMTSSRDGKWAPADCPVTVPVFQDFWVEYRDTPGVRFGAWFSAQAGDKAAPSYTFGNGLQLLNKGPYAEARWVMTATLFLLEGDRLSGPLLGVTYALAEDGSRLHRSIFLCANGKQEPAPEDVGHVDIVPLFAISLMQCKNVTLVDEPRPEKLAKALAKRGREPKLRFKVLEIEPMKRVLRDEGKAESVGLKQALHICRGHFKDYRQSGLFGRVKGIFWWDSTVRGSAEKGTIAKDYAVVAPPVPQGNA